MLELLLKVTTHSDQKTVAEYHLILRIQGTCILISKLWTDSKYTAIFSKIRLIQINQ